MKTLDLLIIALATWRLAWMLIKENGPGGFFLWLRDGAIWPRWFGWLRGLLGCVFCMSVWTGFVCVALHELGLQIVLLPFAASAAGLMLASWTGVEISNDYHGGK